MNRCKWCDQGIYKRVGRIWLCVKHHQFARMRARAKAANKYSPSYTELENMLSNILPGFLCEHCKTKMNWLKSENPKSVLTLQHDRSGKLRFLCFSCNSKHASVPDDLFYEIPVGFKFCSVCKQIKPLGYFHFSNIRIGRRQSKCKICTSLIKQPYTEKKRAYNKNYRQFRTASGNPIIHKRNYVKKTIKEYCRGEMSPSSKLKTIDVKTILNLYNNGCDVKTLSYNFNVSKVSIYKIINRKSWCHVC